MPHRPTLAASIAVFRDGRVLLATRTKPPAAGVWSLPGGRVEAGETLEQAALRELREEVGVEAEIVGFNRHVEVIRRNGGGEVEAHFVVASFVGRWLSGEPQAGPEAGEVAWVAPHNVSGLRTTASLGEVVQRAAAIIGGKG
jgi:ADP-ribose pyrophosphatase YjhB (NUDIX family)